MGPRLHPLDADVIQHAVPRLVLALLIATFLATGLQGINFGTHWDEQSLANRVKWSVEHGGTLLPGSYDWPSVPYWLALIALAPDVGVPESFSGGEMTALEQRLVARVDSPEYRLRLRRLFLALTTFALVWAYLGAAAWSGTEWAGVVAAGALGGSWQIAYHARWPAPDGPLLNFVALVVLGAVLTRTKPSSRAGPTIAAIACGLALGTKYTAWPFAVAWLASDAAWRASQHAAWLRSAVRGAAITAAVFLLTTPGLVLQPFQFIGSLAYLRRHYSEDATALAVYVVGAGWPIFNASIGYIAAVLWSPWLPVALVVAAMSAAGVFIMSRRDWTMALLLAGGPVFLVAAMSMQPVLIVRNLLPVAAPLAVATGVAAAASVRGARWRAAIVPLIAVVIAAHVAHLAYAARTIVSPPDLSAHAHQRGVVAPGAAKLYPPPLVKRPRVLGPLDVDVLYYPTWLGSQHLLVLQ